MFDIIIAMRVENRYQETLLKFKGKVHTLVHFSKLLIDKEWINDLACDARCIHRAGVPVHVTRRY